MKPKKKEMAMTATIMGYPWWLPWLWWLPVAALLPPVGRFSFTIVRLLYDFTLFELQVCVLKLYLATKGATFHSSTIVHHLLLVFRLDQREKELRRKIARILC